MKFVFAKLHCEQSDFLIANTALPKNPKELCAKICNRHTGAGAEGVVFLQENANGYIAHQFNKDGSSTLLCDTALRCVAEYLRPSNVKAISLTIANEKFIHNVQLLSPSLIRTRINSISFSQEKIQPLKLKQNMINQLCEIHGEGIYITAVSSHIPYAVVFSSNIASVDAGAKGGLFQNSRIFQNGINVVFIQIVDKTCVKLRAYRFGCGEVAACGNAAAAAVFTANHLQLCENEVNAVFQKSAMKINLEDNNANITATAHYVGDFEIRGSI